MATPTQAQISSALTRKGTNLCAWATGRDYKYNTVYNTVKRWSGRNDRTPHGGIARQIMKEIADYVKAAEIPTGEQQ